MMEQFIQSQSMKDFVWQVLMISC